MFREMRRARQALSKEECEAILHRATCGVLAVSGDDGYPYAVPLSYVYADGRLLFHCAQSGHKLDAIRRSEKASFCVVDQDDVVPERFTTHYRSVIAFGRAQVLSDDGDRRRALELLGAKYSPGDAQALEREIEQSLSRTCLLALTIEHLTGKEAIELVRAKEKA